jgi:hypothetical protein
MIPVPDISNAEKYIYIRRLRRKVFLSDIKTWMKWQKELEK